MTYAAVYALLYVFRYTGHIPVSPFGMVYCHDINDTSTPRTATSAVIQAAQAGNGGWFAKGVAFDFTDPNSGVDLKVNPFFDSNHDGALDIESEILPRLGDWVDSQLKPGGVIAFARQLPSVSEQAPHLRMPVLVLQGENDAGTRAKRVGVLDAAFAANPDYTLKRYAGLGHSLGPATSVIDDNLRPIVAAPMDDTLAWLLLRATRSPVPAEGPMLFPQTGYRLEGAFLSFWRANGGLRVFGYPDDSPRDVDGDVRQYLERARFELHPDNAAPYTVVLGRLGVEALERQGRAWQSFPRADPHTRHYFVETGHAIAPEFWGYWRGHGLELGDPGVSDRESIGLFGYPISEAHMETNSDGETVLTQWFERARLELHPTSRQPYRIALGRLGAELQSRLQR